MTCIIENDLQGRVHRTICSIIFQHWAYTCFKWYSLLYHGNMFSMHSMILHFRFYSAYSKNKNPLSFCLPPLIWLLFAGTEGTWGDHHSLALRDKNAVYNFGSSLAISCTCRLLERVQGRTVSSIYGIGWALITQGSQRCHTCSGFDLGHWCYYTVFL